MKLDFFLRTVTPGSPLSPLAPLMPGPPWNTNQTYAVKTHIISESCALTNKVTAKKTLREHVTYQTPLFKRGNFRSFQRLQ